MFRPELVDRGQCDEPLCLGLTRTNAGENILALSLKRLPLSLNDSFIFVQELPDIQAVSFDGSLQAVRVVLQLGVVDAVLDE